MPLLMIGLSSHFQPARMRQQPVVHRTAPHELDSRPPVLADALFDTVIELCEAHAAGADIGFERVPSLFDEVLRQGATSKPRPAWPASAAHAAGKAEAGRSLGPPANCPRSASWPTAEPAWFRSRQDEEALRQQYADGSDGQQLRALTNLTCLVRVRARVRVRVS